MNIPPKKRISVARNVHMPSVDASFCWGMSSNCSANAACASGISRLLRFWRVLIRRSSDDGGFLEIMFCWRRWRLPFEASCIPGIWPGLFAVLERPDEINQREHVTDSENGCPGGGEDVVDLKL